MRARFSLFVRERRARVCGFLSYLCVLHLLSARCPRWRVSAAPDVRRTARPLPPLPASSSTRSLCHYKHANRRKRRALHLNTNRTVSCNRVRLHRLFRLLACGARASSTYLVGSQRCTRATACCHIPEGRCNMYLQAAGPRDFRRVLR